MDAGGTLLAARPGPAAMAEVAGGGKFAGRGPSGRVQRRRGGRHDRAVGGDRHDRGDRLAAGDRAGDRRDGQRAVRGRPGQARLGRLAGVAEHGSGRHAAGIALGELLDVTLRGGIHLGLQLAAVHQPGDQEAEHERLDQHHDDERDENVGGDQPAR